MISNSDLTIQTYRENFEKYADKTAIEPSGELKKWLDLFASLLPNEGKVFEIGSATGRDARYLAANGFHVTCADVIPEALQRLSEQGFETVEYDFRDDLNPEWIDKFEGVLANASLLHATQPIFENALKNIALMLKLDGVFAFSLKTGEGEEITLQIFQISLRIRNSENSD
jgi:SAM-dependent methyltransferase